MLFCKKIIFFLCCNFLLANYVYWEPEILAPGEEITIYYNTIDGELPNNTFPVYIHLGYNGWIDVDDYVMSYDPSQGVGWWKYNYQIPENAETIDFVFTDLNDNWDNNGGIGIDWHISLNYYWAPFNPTPNDQFEVILNNIDQGGYLVWTVDTGSGHELPLEIYWPNGSYLNEGVLYTPLNLTSNNSASVVFEPFQSGSQVVSSLKFKLLWDNGMYDMGENGQIIYYDIYFDYEVYNEDPYIEFITPQNNEQIMGDVQISCQGGADSIELWLDGNLLTTVYDDTFEYLWQPEHGLFGDLQLIAKAISNDGRVSFTFVDFYLLYELSYLPVPSDVTDGVNIDNNNVIISLYAPNKEYVSIKGSWNTQFPNGEIMNFSGDSLWWYQVELDDGSYSYQYNLEGIKFVADPWSHDVTWVDPFTGKESSNFQHAKTNFNIGEDDYEWNDESFIIPEMKDAIIYETHIGDFLGVEDEIGTYTNIINKINAGYFNDLGINVIELMPINEFEGEFSWGYNPSFALAPESIYGTPTELKNLIDIAHQNNIAIILDVVFNHMWGSSPLFQLYQPLDNYNWYDHDFENCPYFDEAPSDWGYKLQHWHEINGNDYRAWKYVQDALVHWVENYHIDGFRFDYVEGMGWDGDYNGASFYANLLDNLDPSLILIAEADNSYQINNTDFDSGWDYSFHHNMFDNILGIFLDINNVANHINAYSQGYGFVTGPINYIESHDESRLVYQSVEFENHSLEDAYKRSMLGATILFTSHGVPMLYNGQEFGQNSPVRDQYGYPIPQPLQWSNLENEQIQNLNNHYKKMIALRKDYNILSEPPMEIKYTNNNTNSIIYWRVDTNEKVVVATNFGANNQFLDIEFPNSGEWLEIVNDVVINIDSNWYGDYNLMPLSSYVFIQSDHSTLCTIGDINLDNIINVLDIVFLVNYIFGSGDFSDVQLCAADLNVDEIINVLDIVLLVNIILSI